MAILESDHNARRAQALFEFTQGIDVDARLAAQEIRVQKAWAGALVPVGALTLEEAAQIVAALDEAGRLMAEGGFQWRIEDEDVHMNLERFVTERCGALGKRMHLGRSRNDLIATTLRLFVADTCASTSTGLKGLARALAAQAAAQADVIVPGMTHLQHGQPVRLGHALAAHAWAYARDIERVELAGKRALLHLPLGAAALAGTTLEVNLPSLARTLGFSHPAHNSYDAVGDRDFIVEALDAFASTAVHLSRLAEDMIYWSSTAIGLVKLPTAWSTGSSIMPNKRNPDVPELVRGKSSHVISAAAGAHALLKGLPTSYDSDLHELKGVYLRALDALTACLGAFTPFVEGITVDPARAQALCSTGHILATEIADGLAAQGLPFRDAYARVAALVEQAEAQGKQVHEIETGVAGLGFEAAVERRSNVGGTSKARLEAQLEELKARLR